LCANIKFIACAEDENGLGVANNNNLNNGHTGNYIGLYWYNPLNTSRRIHGGGGMPP